MEWCKKHPKYRANKEPKNLCEKCLSIYLTLKGRRVPTPPPSKVFKDKSKYTRKDKHKKSF